MISSPLFEYSVASSTVIVRVQPSSVSSEMSLPEIAVMVMPPKKWPGPPKPGPPKPGPPPKPRRPFTAPVAPSVESLPASVLVGAKDEPTASIATATSAAAPMPRRPIRARVAVRWLATAAPPFDAIPGSRLGGTVFGGTASAALPRAPGSPARVGR